MAGLRGDVSRVVPRQSLRPVLLQTRPRKSLQCRRIYTRCSDSFRKRSIGLLRVSSDDRYFVYILSNASRTLYIGVTNDLVRRVHEHKQKQVPGFTAQYNVTQLVYYEEAWCASAGGDCARKGAEGVASLAESGTRLRGEPNLERPR